MSATSVTWSVDDARFEVSEVAPGAFVLQLAEGQALDYETETTVAVTVTATDSGGLSIDREIDFAVNNIDEAPTGPGGLSTWTPDLVEAGLRRAVLSPEAGFVDPEGDPLSYTLNGISSGGTFFVGDDKVRVGDILTQADFDAMTLRAPSAAGIVTATFAVSDGVNISPLNFTVTVTPGVDGLFNGTENADVLDGGDGNDTLNGLQGKDSLYGGDGHDTLNGGGGSDHLYGGKGGDTLVGSGGGDRLYGENGSDTLQGGAGNDMLWGGQGADVHNGGNGFDFARYDDHNYGNLVVSLLDPGQNTGAAEGDTYVSIEGIIGGKGNDTLTGDGGDNELRGGNGADRLDGGLGSDTLRGDNGADTFVFATALGASNVDTLTDFTSGEDKIELAAAVFDTLGGSVTVDQLAFDTVATTADHRLIYDQATGTLSYDADGVGGAASVQFALLEPGTVLQASDFLIG